VTVVSGRGPFSAEGRAFAVLADGIPVAIAVAEAGLESRWRVFGERGEVTEFAGRSREFLAFLAAVPDLIAEGRLRPLEPDRMTRPPPGR